MEKTKADEFLSIEKLTQDVRRLETEVDRWKSRAVMNLKNLNKQIAITEKLREQRDHYIDEWCKIAPPGFASPAYIREYRDQLVEKHLKERK